VGIGGPDFLSHSTGLTSAGDGVGLSGGGGGSNTPLGGGAPSGTWSVASAAKHIFGRARSSSVPASANQFLNNTSTPAGVRAASPSLLGHRPSSPTGSVTSMAQETTCPAISLYPPSPNVSAPSLVLTTPDTLHRDSIDAPPSTSPIFPVTGAVKTLCNRGAAIVSIHLAEPVLYVTGFEPQEYQDRSPALLRGSLLLKLLKPTKIKAITLVFRGRARTEWPEGIPPKKCEFFEEKELMTHTWPFFNAQFTSAEYSHGADAARLIDSQRSSTDITRVSMDSVSGVSLSDSQSSRSITPVGSPMLNANSQNGTWGIPFGQSSSKDEKTQAQVKGYRIFAAGEYVYVYFIFIPDLRYNFELPLNSDLPESLECDLGSVRYELEATVERAGAFKSNLSGRTEVLLVRNPAEQNLETYEPIAITRTWYSILTIQLTDREDQLHYEILISGKAFPLNGVIPIAFKFTPLAKVRLHRIKVYLTENVEYFCRDKKVHRFEPMRKLLLFEKAAQKSNGETTPRPTGRQNSIPSVNATDNGISIAGSRTASANSLGPITRLTRPGLGRHSPPKDDISAHSLLGNLEGGDGISSEFELDVKLPGCQSVRTPLDPKNKNSPLIPVKFHHGTIWPNLVVHHWIKIVLRISKADETRENHGKRRHFEISIDSPIHLLSVLLH